MFTPVEAWNHAFSLMLAMTLLMIPFYQERGDLRWTIFTFFCEYFFWCGIWRNAAVIEDGSLTERGEQLQEWAECRHVLVDGIGQGFNWRSNKRTDLFSLCSWPKPHCSGLPKQKCAMRLLELGLTGLASHTCAVLAGRTLSWTTRVNALHSRVFEPVYCEIWIIDKIWFYNDQKHEWSDSKYCQSFFMQLVCADILS